MNQVPLGFQYFTQKAKSRLLWRYIVRVANRAPNQRAELLAWARHEFEMNRAETDPEKIRYLVTEGLRRAREVEAMVQHTG